MSVNASYIVHSCEPGNTTMRVALPDGSEVDAVVQGLTVELVSRVHGTVTLRFAGSEVQAARDTFTVGRSIVASFAGN